MSAATLDCASISCDELAQLLRCGGAVVVDVRPFDDYSEQHVVSALAVRLSSLLRRRLTQGRIGLGDVICDPDRRWLSKSPDAMVVVYDDAASFAGPVPYNTSLALHIVLMSLQREGVNCAFLHGGFTAFAAAQPSLVQSSSPADADPCASQRSSLQLPVCGLGVPCRSPPALSQAHMPPQTPAVMPATHAALQAHLPPGMAEQLERERVCRAPYSPPQQPQPQRHSPLHAGRASLGSFEQQQRQQQRPQHFHHHHHLHHLPTALPSPPLYTPPAAGRARGHVRSHSLPTTAPSPSPSLAHSVQLPSPFGTPTTSVSVMHTSRTGGDPNGGGGGGSSSSSQTSMHVHHFHHHYNGGGGHGHGPRPALALPSQQQQQQQQQAPVPPTPAPGGGADRTHSHDGRPNITVPISQVLNFVYLGSRREASDKAQLKSLGIGYVLNMTADVPNYFPDAFQYQQVPILDTWNQHIQEYFEVAFEFINQARSEGKAVLVHCSAGISRSAAIVIGYLMKEFSLSLNDAHQFVRSRREIISPNLDFMGELTEYETKLIRDRETEKRPVISATPSISSAGMTFPGGPVA